MQLPSTGAKRQLQATSNKLNWARQPPSPKHHHAIVTDSAASDRCQEADAAHHREIVTDAAASDWCQETDAGHQHKILIYLYVEIL